MTMRIVFLKPHKEHKPGDEAFIPRPTARQLCESGDAVPYMTWADAEEIRAKEEPPEDKTDVEENVEEEKPKPKKAPPKRRYKKREKAVTVDDS